MSESPKAVAAFAEVFEDRAWTITTREELASKGFSFDFIAENASAIVFCKETTAVAVEEVSRTLTAEVAAITQRRAIGAKAWEGYLLLLCDGDLQAHERAAQNVQHDLEYCRKIVVSAAEVASASDPNSVALRTVAFLFPIELTGSVPFLDVRSALASSLQRDGIPAAVAGPLVAQFDEPECSCGIRLRTFVRGTKGSTQ
jgi:hypothetical protein